MQQVVAKYKLYLLNHIMFNIFLDLLTWCPNKLIEAKAEALFILTCKAFRAIWKIKIEYYSIYLFLRINVLFKEGKFTVTHGGPAHWFHYADEKLWNVTDVSPGILTSGTKTQLHGEVFMSYCPSWSADSGHRGPQSCPGTTVRFEAAHLLMELSPGDRVRVWSTVHWGHTDVSRRVIVTVFTPTWSLRRLWLCSGLIIFTWKFKIGLKEYKNWVTVWSVLKPELPVFTCDKYKW